MHEQANDALRVTRPLVVEEVEIATPSPTRSYVVRREPHPDEPGAFLTEVIRDDVRPGPGYGDIHTRRAIDWIEDDGRDLDALAREWAAMHNLGRWAA